MPSNVSDFLVGCFFVPFDLLTVKKIKANLPDIFLRNKKKITYFLIDISSLADGNIGKKHAEKLVHGCSNRQSRIIQKVVAF